MRCPRPSADRPARGRGSTGPPGLAARAVASVLGRLWLGPWPRGLRRFARRRTAARAGRWDATDRAYRAELDRAGPRPSLEARARLDALAAHRNAIALWPPSHPTWTGDRLGRSTRVWSWYRLDVVFAWPRLWLVLGENEQNTPRATRAEVDAAATQAGWGVLGLLPALWWWPSLLFAAGVLAVGLRRTRAAVDTLAHLPQAAFDLRAATLARELGFGVPEGRLSPVTGTEITAHLRKNA